MSLVVPLRASDPTVLGGYVLRGRLGEGGQGVVYLGAAASGELVAIKWLRPELSGDAAMVQRFLREVSAAERVAPFCTAALIGTGVEQDRPYIVSEYVDGPSLQQVVQDSGPRSGTALHRLAIGTATALAAIHQAGIVHRDFKPSNVLLAQDGPRVIDFGVARAMDVSLTINTGLVGTPAYMSPEQINGAPAGPASDMFAWAGTMVYAATGRPAFRCIEAEAFSLLEDERRTTWRLPCASACSTAATRRGKSPLDGAPRRRIPVTVDRVVRASSVPAGGCRRHPGDAGRAPYIV